MPLGEQRRSCSSTTEWLDSLQGEAHRKMGSFCSYLPQEASGLLEWLARTLRTRTRKPPNYNCRASYHETGKMSLFKLQIWLGRRADMQRFAFSCRHRCTSQRRG